MTSGTEEEQLAQIKDWWQRNGKPLVLGAVIALVLVFGWQFWQKHQINQAQSASVVYQQLLGAALESGEADAAEVSRLGNLLKKDFAGTHYAQYGSLFVAKVAVESAAWTRPPASCAPSSTSLRTRRWTSWRASVWHVCWQRRTRPTRRSSCSMARWMPPS